MKLLSIDIGIKNLALCIIECNNLDFKILFWNVINLCEENIELCNYCNNDKPCKKCIMCREKIKFINIAYF